MMLMMIRVLMVKVPLYRQHCKLCQILHAPLLSYGLLSISSQNVDHLCVLVFTAALDSQYSLPGIGRLRQESRHQCYKIAFEFTVTTLLSHRYDLLAPNPAHVNGEYFTV